MQHTNGRMVFSQNFNVRWMFVDRDNVREAFRCQAWNKILADQTSRSGYYNFSFSSLCHISVYSLSTPKLRKRSGKSMCSDTLVMGQVFAAKWTSCRRSECTDNFCECIHPEA